MTRSKRLTKQDRKAIIAARKQRRYVEGDELVLVNREIRRVSR